MGILDLRFGYFARGGPNTVIDDMGSAFNRKRQDEINQFSNWFSLKRRTFKQFMTSDTLAKRQKFEIKSDNCRLNIQNLLQISEISDARFSVVIGNVDGDLRNQDVFHTENSMDILQIIHDKIENFQIQIFSINDEVAPLTPNILNSKNDNEVPFYLMNNAVRSRESINYWIKRNIK
jgi:hypothetical protein